MSNLPQFLINGLFIGSLYALIGGGLSLTFSIMRVVNAAHGEFLMVGAYATWAITVFLIDSFILACIVAVVTGALLGAIIERVAYRSTYGKPITYQMIVATAVLLILQELVLIAFTGVSRSVQTPLRSVWTVGASAISEYRMLVVGISAAVLFATMIFLSYSKPGKALRATAQNTVAARLVGVRVYRMASYAFIAGGILAAIAGALLSPVLAVSPFMGSQFLGISFVVVIMGGLGSFAGAVIAGVLLGLVESIFSGYISTEWSYAVLFVFMILMMQLRPKGLLGKD